MQLSIITHLFRLLSLGLVFEMALTVWASGGRAAEIASGGGHSPRFALLVGVQEYPKLGPNEQLKGCRNDVEAMKRLLMDRYRFSSEGVRTLVDSEATSTSIRRHLKGLIDRVRGTPAGGQRPQVVFYFSGHGSLMPDQPEGHPDCDKLDGLDQTLVPYDAEKQGGERDVRDDELHHFAEAICRDGHATLLVLLDCCHSGRGVRGTTRFRGLERDIEIPPPVSGGERKVKEKEWPAGAVILTACRKAEKEPEYDEGDSSHGLMTRFLVELLNSEDAPSRLNYETLRAALIKRYQDARLSVAAPTPTLEAHPVQRWVLSSPVLAADSVMDRKLFWPAEASDLGRGTVRLQAGLLHGVTKGSLYELYERPEHIIWDPGRAKVETKTSVAWLRIETVENVVATGTVFEWEGPEQQEQIDSVLPKGFKRGFAVKRRPAPSEFRTRVRVVKAIDLNTDGPPLGPSDREVPSVIRETLEQGRRSQGSAWFTWVQGSTPCDVLLRIDGQHAALFPAIGWAGRPDSPAKACSSVPKSLAGGWAPLDLSDPVEACRKLKDALRRITHASELLRNAAKATPPDGSSIRLQAEVVRVTTIKKGGDYHIEKYHSLPKDRSLVLRNEEDFVVRLKNLGDDGKAVYATVLFIDPDLEIQCMLPDRHVQGEVDSQRIEPGGEPRVTRAYRCMPPFGPHRIVVISTQDKNNCDFSFLTQPSLRRGTFGVATVLSFDVRP